MGTVRFPFALSGSVVFGFVFLFYASVRFHLGSVDYSREISLGVRSGVTGKR